MLSRTSWASTERTKNRTVGIDVQRDKENEKRLEFQFVQHMYSNPSSPKACVVVYKGLKIIVMVDDVKGTPCWTSLLDLQLFKHAPSESGCVNLL